MSHPILSGWRIVWLAMLGLGLVGAQAQVIVTPHCMVLQPGQTGTFRARSAARGAAGPEPAWRWSLPKGGEGSVHEDTGVYTAPLGAGIRRIRVRATHRADAERFGEATVTVLPKEPFDLVGKVLGPDWVEPYSDAWPFLDLATGRRFPAPGWVSERSSPARTDTRFRTGCGQPCLLRWDACPGAQAQLLSFTEGNEVVRKDVTGQEAQAITPRAPVGRCRVESLCATDPSEPGWRSRTQHLQVDVRGVFPLAGNPSAAGHADGRGLSARFRDAFAAVLVPMRAGVSLKTWHLLVTDPRAHVLRRVTPGGEVSTFCGEPDEAGHQDSHGLVRRLASRLCGRELPTPRFHRPTYLVRQSFSFHAESCEWDALVSDSGNHAIRRVDSGGRVTTLAGTPGQAGHVDADAPREALLNDPRGLAVDGEHGIYVADRGNHAIRSICFWSGVRTLAGSPGRAGIDDGADYAARFKDLKGMTYHDSPAHRRCLFVLDGHAVRKISLPDGTVTTVLGQVDTPGFRDLPPGPADAPDLRQPCLRDPVGIRSLNGRLFIADQGNHALRELDLETNGLRTLAGDPLEPETRWGLLRDGIPGLPGPAYAALQAPTDVCPAMDGPADALVVCTGPALAELRDGMETRDRPAAIQLDCFPAAAWEPCTVTFTVRTENRHGHATVRPLHYTVDFLDPGGALAERREGQASSADLVAVQGTFTGAGKGAVVLRCVTDEGVSGGARQDVEIGE